MANVENLWEHGTEDQWKYALRSYWDYVTPKNMDLERRFDSLNLADVEDLDASGWYGFLMNEYFLWKYTQGSRLARNRNLLKKHLKDDDLQRLLRMRDRISFFGRNGYYFDAYKVAREVHGLGAAGGSGLAAVLFPHGFGTVDDFAVEALQKIENLPSHEAVLTMNGQDLKDRDIEIINDVYLAKSLELNKRFGTEHWTPRKIDMVLWATR